MRRSVWGYYGSFKKHYRLFICIKTFVYNYTEVTQSTFIRVLTPLVSPVIRPSSIIVVV